MPAPCASDVRGEAFASGTLDDRVAGLRSYARGAAGRPVSLVVTDAVLSDALRRQMVASGGPQLQDPAVVIRSEGIRISGTATAAFFRFPITATLVPEVSGGRLAFTVRDLQTGGLPRDQVEPALRQASDPASWGLAMRVEAMILRSGCGIVRGTAQA
ncbi:MAG TPA: hypothetical protein VFM93_07765 [Candidatus Limnocylindria bacterium]|nr:hypothetical protein [Candidatus Limnocylindria bacterium]